jgi:hypothetical protein
MTDSGADPRAFVPVAEVLGRITFGRADGFTDDAATRMEERWGGILHFAVTIDPEHNVLVQALERLLAREQWWREWKQVPGAPLPPLSRALRATVRLAWHRHGRRPFRELLPELLANLAAYPQLLEARKALWTRAARVFVAVADERGVRVLGRQKVPGQPESMSPTPEAVDLVLFSHDRRIITQDGWTVVLDIHGLSEGGPEYGDLKIWSADLTKFPVRVDGQVDVVDAGVVQSMQSESEDPPEVPQSGDGINAAAVSPGTPSKPVAEAQLLKWHRDRVAGWPIDADPPSREDDLSAARLAFPNHRVTQPNIRTARKGKHVPPAWHVSGPRTRPR